VLLPETQNLRLCKYPLKIVLVRNFTAIWNWITTIEPKNLDCYNIPQIIDEERSWKCHYRFELYHQTRVSASIENQFMGNKNDFTCVDTLSRGKNWISIWRRLNRRYYHWFFSLVWCCTFRIFRMRIFTASFGDRNFKHLNTMK